MVIEIQLFNEGLFALGLKKVLQKQLHWILQSIG